MLHRQDDVIAVQRPAGDVYLVPLPDSRHIGPLNGGAAGVRLAVTDDLLGCCLAVAMLSFSWRL